MPSPRQTQSYLSQRFQEAGIRPETRHGQNFLIDLNLLDLLLDTAALGPSDVVLEVGTGLASLTARMAELAAAVVTVEIDARLFQLAAEELSECNNVVMLRQDALKNKNHMHPAVLDAVRAKMAEESGRQFKLVANLPYNVATPILSNLLSFDPLPVSMTATIQKELADRICAAPGTKDIRALRSGCRRSATSPSFERCRRRCFGRGPRCTRQSSTLSPITRSGPKSPTCPTFTTLSARCSCIAASTCAAC